MNLFLDVLVINLDPKEIQTITQCRMIWALYQVLVNPRPLLNLRGKQAPKLQIQNAYLF